MKEFLILTSMRRSANSDTRILQDIFQGNAYEKNLPEIMLIAMSEQPIEMKGEVLQHINPL